MGGRRRLDGGGIGFEFDGEADGGERALHGAVDLPAEPAGLQVRIGEDFLERLDRGVHGLVRQEQRGPLRLGFGLEDLREGEAHRFLLGLGGSTHLQASDVLGAMSAGIGRTRLPRWVPLLLAGLMLNLVVMWANGGWMPMPPLDAIGWNDRFALAPMLGVGLMVIGLLLWVVRPAGQKFILGFLLVFSIAVAYPTDVRQRF